MKRVINLVALAVLFSSCSRRELSRSAYLSFMSDEKNGYVQHHKVGNHDYRIQLATPEFVACKQFEGNSGDKGALIERVRQLDSSISFVIKMQTHNAEGDRNLRPQTVAEADQAVAYYGQSAMKDIRLRVGEQLLSPVAYEYENNYGLVPYNTIVVVFKTKHPGERLTLTMDDRYRGVYALTAEYPSKLITAAPKLKLN